MGILDRIHLMKAERNGKEVEFAQVDGGVSFATDNRGNQYLAAKDILVFDDVTIVVEIDKELLDMVTNQIEFRLAETLAYLEGIGVDPTSVRPA